MDNLKSSVLTKGSSQAQIKIYFEKVLELSRGSDLFPVNLDEVWPLVYTERGKAVRALKNEFVEGEDFTSFAQNGKTEAGGFRQIIYYISTSCLEYFIARKVRPVFEVYRQVFHRIAQQKPMTQAEILLQNAQMLVEQERKVSRLEAKIDEIDIRTQTRPDFFTIVGYGTLNGYSVNLTLASRLGQKASRKCKELGIQTDVVPDPRFGQVKMYPTQVLREIFNEAIG